MKTKAENKELERKISEIEEFWARKAPDKYEGWSWMKVPGQALREIDSYTRVAKLELGAEPVDWDSPETRLGVKDAIDAHSHLEGYPETPELVEELEEILDNAGVKYIVSLTLMKFWDDFLRELEMWQEGPLGGRVLPFPSFDWKLDEPDFVERACRFLEQCAERGARGLKVHKNVGLEIRSNGEVVPLTDSRYREVFAHAGEVGLPVWIHYGDPYDFFFPVEGNRRSRELTCFPDWQWYPKSFGEKEYWQLHEQFFRLIEETPGTNFNAVHLANYPWHKIDEFSRLLRDHDNLYSDISGRMAETGMGKTLEDRQHRAEKTRQLFIDRQDKIIWGTDILPTDKLYKLWAMFLRSGRRDIDYTWATFYPGQGDWLVDGLDLPEDVLRKICRDVAAGLLGLED